MVNYLFWSINNLFKEDSDVEDSPGFSTCQVRIEDVDKVTGQFVPYCIRQQGINCPDIS